MTGKGDERGEQHEGREAENDNLPDAIAPEHSAEHEGRHRHSKRLQGVGQPDEVFAEV